MSHSHDEHKVSIIIPAYNAESYLDSCLSSVTSQSYSNLEIIVIDDGSMDRTPSVIRKWARRDGRIRWYRHENRGVSYSRNFGIQQATGLYLSFVDADDVVDTDFVQLLHHMFSDDLVDCAVVGIVSFGGSDLPTFDTGTMRMLSRELAIQSLFGECGGFMANKMYRSDLVKDWAVYLDERYSVSEDLLFNLSYFKRVNKVAYNNGVKYGYRQHGMSAVNDVENRRWFDILDVYAQVFEIVNDEEIRHSLEFQFAVLLCEARERVQYLSADPFIVEHIDELEDQYATTHLPFSPRERAKLFLFRRFPHIVMRFKRRQVRS